MRPGPCRTWQEKEEEGLKGSRGEGGGGRGREGAKGRGEGEEKGRGRGGGGAAEALTWVLWPLCLSPPWLPGPLPTLETAEAARSLPLRCEGHPSPQAPWGAGNFLKLRLPPPQP